MQHYMALVVLNVMIVGEVVVDIWLPHCSDETEVQFMTSTPT